MYMENLPDGMHDVLVSRHGGLYIAGFDSRRRVCLVLFAPPFGNPLRTVSELPYRDYGRFTPTVRAAKDPARADNLYVLLYLHPDNLGLMQTSLYRIDVLTGRQVLLTASSSPFWAPEGMLPRADGTVLVALSGLGPLLVYNDCDEKKCSPTRRWYRTRQMRRAKAASPTSTGCSASSRVQPLSMARAVSLSARFMMVGAADCEHAKPDHAQGWEVGARSLTMVSTMMRTILALAITAVAAAPAWAAGATAADVRTWPTAAKPPVVTGAAIALQA